MLDLGYLHPIVVHFTVTLLIVGVLLRWVSLTGKVPFAGPAAQVAKALQAQGNTNLARKELERLQKTFPQSRMLKRAFEGL